MVSGTSKNSVIWKYEEDMKNYVGNVKEYVEGSNFFFQSRGKLGSLSDIFPSVTSSRRNGSGVYSQILD